jgi:hypothetical protein
MLLLFPLLIAIDNRYGGIDKKYWTASVALTQTCAEMRGLDASPFLKSGREDA